VPKKKSYPYALKYPKSPNPLKEMSKCIENKIYVSCDIEAFKVGGYWEMGNKYRLVIKNGSDTRRSDYVYDKDNIVDAIYDTYREIYKRNYGKQTEVNRD
jgi:hypothetical protein